jgi:hypothetical protein
LEAVWVNFNVQHDLICFEKIEGNSWLWLVEVFKLKEVAKGRIF